MSYTFQLKTPVPPGGEALFEAVGDAGLVCAERSLEELAGPWPDEVLHFYREGLSTRAVEVAYDGVTFKVKILTASCPDDYGLALDFVCAAARDVGGEVESEEGVGFPAEERDAHYGPDWIAEHIRKEVSHVVGLAIKEQQIVTMGCTTRNFYLGPRVAHEILQGPSDTTPERLFERIRELMYIDLDAAESIVPAEVMSVDGRDGQPMRFAVWEPGVITLFPDVERLALLSDDRIMIPYRSLEALAGRGRVTWLDERHALVGAVPPDEWDGLVRKARPLAC